MAVMAILATTGLPPRERGVGEGPSEKPRNPNHLKRSAVVHANHLRTGIDARNHCRAAKSVQRIDSITCTASQDLLAFRVAENSRGWREFSFASLLTACCDNDAPHEQRTCTSPGEWASCLLAPCRFGVRAERPSSIARRPMRALPLLPLLLLLVPGRPSCLTGASLTNPQRLSCGVIKNAKTIVLILAIFLLTISLMACGGGEGPAEQPGSGQGTQPAGATAEARAEEDAPTATSAARTGAATVTPQYGSAPTPGATSDGQGQESTPTATGAASAGTAGSTPQATRPSASSTQPTPAIARTTPGAGPTPAPTPEPSGSQCAPRDPATIAVRPSPGTSPETDREALVALFNATNGESWDDSGT